MGKGVRNMIFYRTTTVTRTIVLSNGDGDCGGDGDCVGDCKLW